MVYMKILHSTTVLNKLLEMILEHQISILIISERTSEEYNYGYTKNSALQSEINYIIKYVRIINSYFKL